MRRAPWVCLAAVGLSIGLRAVYVMQPWRVDCAVLPLWLGDEGSTAVLASHVLRGARPTLMLGAYHLGTFDCYMTALSFHFFGVSLAAARLVAHGGAFASALLVYLVGRKLYGKQAGLLAAVVVLLPSTFVFLWTAMMLVPNISFTPAVLLVLYATLSVLEAPGRRKRQFLLGISWGFAIWESLLGTGYVAVSAGAILLRSDVCRRDLVAVALGFLLGAAPLIYANLEEPLVSTAQLARKIRHSLSMAEDVSTQGRRAYLGHPLLQVLGAQGEGQGAWTPLGMGGALFLLVGFVGALRRLRRCPDRAPFRGQVLLFAFVAVAFLEGLSGFSGQPVGRYQLPLFPIVAVLATGWAVQTAPRLAVMLVAMVALLNAAAIAVAPSCENAALPEEIIAALKGRGLHYGYAAGQMYDLMLRSQGEIVVVPLEHSRFPEDEARVGAAERIFYVFRADQEDKAIHAAFVRLLRENGVRYEEATVKNFRILYGFQPRENLSSAAIADLVRRFRADRWGESR